MSTKRAGRPTINEVPLTRTTVYLTPDQVLSAHTTGSGNVSDGLRRQLDELVALRQWVRERVSRATQPAVVPRRRHQ